jgi:outer membrane biosynthesis protein TonB
VLQKIAKKMLPKNFSGREALWIAILLHLVFLFLPQAMVMMQEAVAPPEAEPLKFNFKQPDEPLSNVTEEPEEHKATTTEQTELPPETDQPNAPGTTNQRTMESLPQQQAAQPSPDQKPAEKQERIDPLQALRQQRYVEQRRQQEEAEAAKQSEALKEAIQQDLNNFRPAEVPLTYNNQKSSSAEVDSFIQFDTYDWSYEDYQARMIRKLYQYWVPKLQTIGIFNLGKPGRTIVKFHINLDGSLRTVELITASGKRAYDIAANHAIISPFPGFDTAFPALPLGFPKETLGVTVGFFVNMDMPNN